MTKAIDDFLKELTAQFDRLVDVKERLDNKANNLMTMSGTICTILLAVGVFLLKSISSTHPMFNAMLTLFALGIGFLIVSIALSINSYKLRDQTYPVGSKLFFDKDCCYQGDVVTEYSDADETEFKELMLHDYLYSIKDAEKKISGKGTSLKWAQVFFLAGLLLVPIIILTSIFVFGKIPVSE